MNPDLKIARLGHGDADEAAPLLAEYIHGDKWTSEQEADCKDIWKRLSDSGYSFALIARSVGKCAGFLTCYYGFSVSKGLPILHIQALFTASAHRNKGLARALLQRADELAVQAGAHRLQLETDIDNLAARSLYESTGYMHIGHKEVYMRPLKSWQ